MSQGAIRPETPRDREERRVLQADLAESPLTGAPLALRPRNFVPDADAAIRALGGPVVWMQRLRAIEEGIREHEELLDEAWRTLDAEVADDAEFARRWRETAAAWSFAELNELIDGHNRWFPAEARLAMDPRTRDYVRVNGRPYRRRPLDEAWILAGWPAVRSPADRRRRPR